jgi:hypothetical protein
MGNKVLVCALLVLLLPGCAVTRSTGSEVVGAPSRVYHLTADQADHVLQESMVEEFPSEAISSVALPNKGYKVELHFVLDHHTIVAYAIPQSGGYVFEVNSSGTMILQGEIRAKNLFKKIVAHASTATQS